MDAEQVEFLAGWLKASSAGQMNYMHRNYEKRINPARLLENAKSVICLGLNYTPPRTQIEPAEPAGPAGRIANYAQYEDYHSFMKKRLRKLIDSIRSRVRTDLKFKICVDSAPLAERSLAERAGLGFIGKNHMLIHPKLGPQIFLGEIVTDLELQADELGAGTCSQCNKCVDACPTGALREDGQFDANKCISYLTIELKGQIPAELAERIGDRLFGCDECVLACPYQKEAPVCKNKQFKFYEDKDKLDLNEVLNLSRELFEAKFADSVIKRLGLERLKRNAQVCLANIKGQKG
ncbi:MAG: tRNA epoxyqueuosine(34) reductase QueG [Planctomycetota bacterium]